MTGTTEKNYNASSIYRKSGTQPWPMHPLKWPSPVNGPLEGPVENYNFTDAIIIGNPLFPVKLQLCGYEKRALDSEQVLSAPMLETAGVPLNSPVRAQERVVLSQQIRFEFFSAVASFSQTFSCIYTFSV